jgi:3-oxoacyl-[acyl-carrier-protein] synthase III
MAKSVFKGIKISGIAGAVPSSKIRNLTDHNFCSQDDRQKIVALTKVTEYRKASVEMCASDLCQASAEALLCGLDRQPAEIDAIVFATMTGDYRVPSTACLLQDRLKCRNTVVAYDIQMGCSGFIVGLYNACSLIQGAGLKKVLLLSWDTQTKLCHEKDKNVVFILADGGTATLLEADAVADDIIIELMTDGSRFQNLYVPAGGFRRPSTNETREIREQPDGGIRSEEHLFMNGMEIFKFSVTDVVKTIADFMEMEKISPQHLEYLFLHQANGFMNEKIARKLKFSDEKVPTTISFFGNTGSASIPLTMAHHFSTVKQVRANHCLLAGFGVGLSWGVAAMTLNEAYFPEVVEL